MIIVPQRTRSIGAFEVRRILPFSQCRSVGHFVFLDDFGPVQMSKQADILPHPHIGLATVTFLFSGQLIHRDSLGSKQLIKPGEINLMTAGKGIVHSERVPTESETEKLLGVQAWLALPEKYEDVEPSFYHYDNLPEIKSQDFQMKVLIGELFGIKSPVETFSDAVYAHCHLKAGARMKFSDYIEEIGIYILSGEIAVENQSFTSGNLLVFKDDESVVLSSLTSSEFLVIGGEKLEKPRYMWWNFVSSSQEKLEEAKRKWERLEFPLIFDDKDEFIPLPEKTAQATPL